MTKNIISIITYPIVILFVLIKVGVLSEKEIYIIFKRIPRTGNPAYLVNLIRIFL